MSASLYSWMNYVLQSIFGIDDNTVADGQCCGWSLEWINDTYITALFYQPLIMSGINERREPEVWVCWYGCCDLYAWSWPLRIESVRPHISLSTNIIYRKPQPLKYRGFSNTIDIHYMCILNGCIIMYMYMCNDINKVNADLFYLADGNPRSKMANITNCVLY